MPHTFDICLASNKPESLNNFFIHHNLGQDGVKYYVVVDDAECEKIARDWSAIPIKNPRPDLGYFGLNHGYQEAFKQSSGEFFTVLTDEIRYPDGWYDRLQDEFVKYLAAYPDRIFRLRVSEFRHKQYQDLMQCMVEPENYSIMTRQWLEAVDGIGEFWGPDSWHQCIEYFMSILCDKFHPKGVRRGFPLEFFEVQGMDAGKGWEGKKAVERNKRIKEGWNYYTSLEYQNRFLYLAYKLRLNIFAYRHGTPIEVDHDEKNNEYIISANKQRLATVSSKLPEFYVRVYEGFRTVGEQTYSKPVLDKEFFSR